MKKSLLSIALITALTTSTIYSSSASAVEGLSANVAVVSQYFFRGISQTDTASASAGVDYEVGNFSVGTWAADVKDGIEVDIYGSYAIELNEFGLSAGFTSYQYTGDFDTAYNEINLGASYKFVSISYNIGTHDVDDASDEDYDFLSITGEYEGFYATYGTWGKDFDGDYVEVGYGAEVSGFYLGVALIVNSKELDLETNKGDESLVFSISKSF
jgi:uncharacterized protein (TIGR02001 family)